MEDDRQPLYAWLVSSYEKEKKKKRSPTPPPVPVVLGMWLKT